MVHGLETMKILNEEAVRKQKRLNVVVELGEGSEAREVHFTLKEARAAWEQLNELFAPKPKLPEVNFHTLVPPSYDWTNPANGPICVEPLSDQFPTVAITANDAPTVVEPFYEDN